MLKTYNYLKSKKKFIAIAFLYMLFINILIRSTGIITNNEAEKYISGALELYRGNFENVIKSHLFYTSYILFLSIFYISKSAITVVVAQSILSYISAICLKKITEYLIGDSPLSYISMVIFLFAFPIQSWTITLFSDSFFVSLSIITLFFTIKKKTGVEFTIWVCLNLILIFSRPPGIFLVLPNITYVALQSKTTNEIASYFTYCVAFTSSIVLLFNMPAETKGYIKPIAAERVIVDSADYTLPDFTNSEKSTIAQAYTYIYTKKNTRQILSLYTRKAFSFFTLNRPYYSKTHNLLLLPFYSLYLLCIIGFYSLWKSKQKVELFLFAASIFGLINLVSLTYNEWHYRFTITIFPYLIILTTVSVNFLLNQRMLNQKK